MAIDVARFNRIKYSDLIEFRDGDIKSFVPQPKDSDYKRGYLVRYFLQKVNDVNSEIFEVSEFNFNRFSENPFFMVKKLNWRLTGPKEDIKESNFKSVKLASKDIPRLSLYLPNYLQFSK